MAIASSSSEAVKHLPPDAELQALAATINGKLKDGRVSFYMTQAAEGQSQFGIVFQCGAKRAPVKLRGRPNESNIADIIAGMEKWAGSPRSGPLYTTEVPEW